MACRIPPTYNLHKETECIYLPYPACDAHRAKLAQAWLDSFREGSVVKSSVSEQGLIRLSRDWLIHNIPCLY